MLVFEISVCFSVSTGTEELLCDELQFDDIMTSRWLQPSNYEFHQADCPCCLGCATNLVICNLRKEYDVMTPNVHTATMCCYTTF